MRRTLTFLLMATLIVAAASAAHATDLQWSGGIQLQEGADQSGVFSRIDVQRSDQVVASWFSTSSVLPIFFNGLDATVYGDFPGISRIKEVVLSPDHGQTKWPARLVRGKGYGVLLPTLSLGGHSLEWGVISKDKHNRLTLIIIPINWSSHRRSAAANHVMIQSAPPGWQDMSDQQLFAFLRGFVPSWATPDPSVLAQMAMMQQSATQPNAPPPPPAKPVALEEISLRLMKGDLFLDIPQVTLPQGTAEGSVLQIMRGEQMVMVVKVTEISDHAAKADILSQNGEIELGDQIVSGGGAA